MDPVTECYQKPFRLFYYNKPKQPELPKVRKIKTKVDPIVPIRLNNATKLRNKAIKQFSSAPYVVDYRLLTEQTERTFSDSPEHPPRHNKTSQYRYKWVRDVPVVSCRFTECCMMYKKPPFTFEKTLRPTCGQFRLRRMEIESPDPGTDDMLEVTTPGPLIPSILM